MSATQQRPAGRPPRPVRAPSARRRATLLALVGLIALAAVGWVAARQIRSPAQIAADAAAPPAAPITVPVERRRLSTNVIVRGTVRFGGRRSVELGASQLKQGSEIITGIARRRAMLDAGDVALSVDDRPAFVLPGSIPMHRDIRRGSRGADVAQLEVALAGQGLRPGPVDGVFDAATQGAVAAFYTARGYEPFGPTDAQLEQLKLAEADAAVARDAHLQALNTLDQARRPPTPGDAEQARIDLNTAQDGVDTAVLALDAARIRLATARAAAATARRVGETVAAATTRREQAAADADVALKREAANLAVQEERLVALDLLAVPLDAPVNERERALAAVNSAREAVTRTKAELAAAIATADAIRAGGAASLRQARTEAANLARDAELARDEVRRAEDGVATARRQVRLTRLRVRALTRPTDTRALEAIVAASAEEARRTRRIVDRLAAESGVQVPANEIVFLPDLPVRVDEVKLRRGMTLSGPALTVTSSRLIVDSSLSAADKALVRVGDRVILDEQDLGIRSRGRVAEIDSTPGTRKVDPNRFYFSVVPSTRALALVGASVRLTIAVESTRGSVLAVPVSAVSVGGDGSARVQVRRGNRTEVVRVVPGLAAETYVAVRPAPGEVLREGDLVVVGRSASQRAGGP